MGLRAGLDKCGKSCLHQGLNPTRSCLLGVVNTDYTVPASMCCVLVYICTALPVYLFPLLGSYGKDESMYLP